MSYTTRCAYAAMHVDFLRRSAVLLLACSSKIHLITYCIFVLLYMLDPFQFSWYCTCNWSNNERPKNWRYSKFLIYCWFFSSYVLMDASKAVASIDVWSFSSYSKYSCSLIPWLRHCPKQQPCTRRLFPPFWCRSFLTFFFPNQPTEKAL